MRLPALVIGCVLVQIYFQPHFIQAQQSGCLTIDSKVELLADQARDQDDLCLWVHPEDQLESLVITSDKEAGRVFVYDLQGQLIQEVPVGMPGNIDIRQGVHITGNRIDVVAVNNRSEDFSLLVFRVDPRTRKLTRIDSGIPTGPNYGGCLYHSSKTKKLYFLCTSKSGVIEQYELNGTKEGQVRGSLVRQWKIGKSEGAVADDARGLFYIGEEEKGVWRVEAEPDSPTPGELVVRVGENGATGDIEGLALLHSENGESTLIVSNQGTSQFLLYQCDEQFKYTGCFRVQGAKSTDGIELVRGAFGPTFPSGIFGCHTDTDRCAILLSSWKDVEARFKQSGNSSKP